MAKYVAAIDQGTTSTRCMIFNHAGEPVGAHQLEHEQIYPKPGWVEHNPLEIWARTQDVVKGAMQAAGATVADIAAVGITNQRETTVVWDKNTGKPYYNAIVWQDTRTDKICNELAKNGGQDRFRGKVGLPLATYFSGPKVKWMLENVDGLREAAERGDAIFGNMDTYVIWHLTGGSHVTDVTNASRTMLMNLETLDWDDEILEIMGIPKQDAAADRPLQRSGNMGQHLGRWSIWWRNSRLWRPGRSAGSHCWPGCPPPRRSQEHLWNRLFHDTEHRHEDSALFPGLVDDSLLQVW